MPDILKNLNPAQREAVTATEGFIRVIAGAGSGKTRALSHRFAFLVNELGILPGNILCVTFTNKAANEMRQRIHALTGDNDTGYINTFHGFCVSVLQEDSYAIQYPKSFLVLDNSDINAMLQIIYEERGLTLREMTYGKARDMIEIRKLFKNPDYYLDMISMSLDGLSYLRMIAYQDDLSFLRVCNRPKRYLGKKRIAFLQEYAAQNNCSLYQTLLENLEEPMFKGIQAQAFTSLIQVFSMDYANRPVSEVLSAILDQSGYEEMLRTEGSQERLDNLAELKQSVYEYETTCGEESTLEDYLAHTAVSVRQSRKESTSGKLPGRIGKSRCTSLVRLGICFIFPQSIPARVKLKPL